MSLLATYPFPKETISKWVRGDYANLTAIIDLTLSRLDASFFTGTRWEGNLTELELQWGRTIGQMPSPYTAGNPLVAPYHWDQGPDVPPLTRRILIQLAIFAIVALVGGAVMVFGYIQLPAMFGVGRYGSPSSCRGRPACIRAATSPIAEPKSVGSSSVRLTDTGVAAVLSLKSGIDIPSDLDAQVHSQSAVGEQYVALLPRRDSPPLQDGDVIRADRVSVPPDSTRCWTRRTGAWSRSRARI